MIITQTPFRVSFFGGGTDYPEYFETHGGAVLGTTINKYAYFSMSKFHSSLFDYNLRIAYRQIECVENVDAIEHRPFRECLKRRGIAKDVEIVYCAEMPSFSGLGTSSTFVVGLLNTLSAYKYALQNPLELAYEAIDIERNVLKDSVGCQDQIFAAVGGFNVIEFKSLRDISVNKILMRPDRMKEFEDCLFLAFTRIFRMSMKIAKRQISKIDSNADKLRVIHKMVYDGYNILTGNSGFEEFGILLDKMWKIKSELDESICTHEIASLYKKGIDSGALGGKLLGAGGGGFILFFVPPKNHKSFKEKMSAHEIIPIKINADGSKVIHMS